MTRGDIAWYTIQKRCITFLYHAIKNTVTNTINATYAQRMMGRLDETPNVQQPSCIIIHQTHDEKSDWSRAFNRFTIACELDMINAISAADIAFIMSSSTSAWLLSPLECSPQKQNG